MLAELGVLPPVAAAVPVDTLGLVATGKPGGLVQAPPGVAAAGVAVVVLMALAKAAVAAVLAYSVRVPMALVVPMAVVAAEVVLLGLLAATRQLQAVEHMVAAAGEIFLARQAAVAVERCASFGAPEDRSRATRRHCSYNGEAKT